MIANSSVPEFSGTDHRLFAVKREPEALRVAEAHVEHMTARHRTDLQQHVYVQGRAVGKAQTIEIPDALARLQQGEIMPAVEYDAGCPVDGYCPDTVGDGFARPHQNTSAVNF